MVQSAVHIFLKLTAHEPEKQDMYHVSLTMHNICIFTVLSFSTE